MNESSPNVKHITLRTLLAKGSFKNTLVPLEAGKLVVDWYVKSGKHRVLVASDKATYTRDKKASVKIKLTAKGKKLLRTETKRATFTATDAFTPKGKKVIKVTKRFTLVART